MSAIADKVGTSKSTISGELGRNSEGRSCEYGAELAQKELPAAPSGGDKKNAFTGQVRGFVELYLERNYSPEQIAGYADRMNRPGPP